MFVDVPMEKPSAHYLRLFVSATLCATLLSTGGCRSTGSSANRSSKTELQAQREAVGGTYVNSAEQAVRDGDLDRALEEFQKAIEVNPELTTAHIGMADIYRVRGDYTRAEQRYGQAARLQPANFDAQYYHGLMLHLLDRLTDAVQAYLRAIALRPNDYKANLNLATAYYQLDENAQALPYARRAVELNPQDGPARVNLGAVYGSLGRHNEAVREYQQAAELMPLNAQLLTNLADSLAKLDRFEEMSNALERAVKMEPSALTHERLGFARFKLGRFDAARMSFEDALKLDANYVPALNGHGVSLLNDWIRGGRRDLSLRDRGLADLRRSLQVSRDQPQILEIVTRYGR